ncbi:hypothetical protein ACNJX9_24580 [Bradyrhizobium sp. DASA03076]|uniref:Uncharacterized protein n=1 Tax=Bradyrhizobium manausense TaxID=989370 RepID=A0A0R3CZR8_9BRAD|nr:hypothetical protein AOQ71_38025 [Bradyrhizobium manausense]
MVRAGRRGVNGRGRHGRAFGHGQGREQGGEALIVTVDVMRTTCRPFREQAPLQLMRLPGPVQDLAIGPELLR